MEIPRDALPRQQDQDAAQQRDDHGGDHAEGGPVRPQRVERERESADHRGGGDEAVARGRVDLGHRDQDQRDANRHRPGQGKGGGDGGEPVKADQADDGQAEEGIDAAAQSFWLKWSAGMVQRRRGGKLKATFDRLR